MPDVLAVVKPTVSKQWRELKALTVSEKFTHSCLIHQLIPERGDTHIIYTGFPAPVCSVFKQW